MNKKKKNQRDANERDRHYYNNFQQRNRASDLLQDQQHKPETCEIIICNNKNKC